MPPPPDMQEQSNAELNRRHVRRRFDSAAASFAGADFVHRATADGLFERLQPMRLAPSLIVDAGSARGAGSRQLARQYRSARVLSLDFSGAMLRQAAASRGWATLGLGKLRNLPYNPLRSRIYEVQADADAMPLAAGSVDLVFANLLLPWLYQPTDFFSEVNRVLRKDGLFVFSTLGPASLLALREAWQTLDSLPHVNAFADMHNVGDAVLKSGLREPVLDVDFLTLSYSEPEALFRDLRNCGARNALRNRQAGLTGKERLRRFLAQLAKADPLTLKLELVYGHAFGGGPRATPGEFRVRPTDIGIRRS